MAAQAVLVEVALVDREAELEDRKRHACEHVVFGTPATCQRCGSSDVSEIDFVETLACTGAEADFVNPFEALNEVGSVAAVLRY